MSTRGNRSYDNLTMAKRATRLFTFDETTEKRKQQAFTRAVTTKHDTAAITGKPV